MAKKKKSNGLLGAGSIPKQIKVKAPKPKKQSDVNWRKAYYGGSEAKQKKIAKKVRRSKELEIFRGEVAPITSSKGDSKKTKKYAAKQERLAKQGKNAREILRLGVGDRSLNPFFNIKSYNVREAQRGGLEQQLKQVEKAIKQQQSRIKKNGGKVPEIPEANFQVLKLGTYTDPKKFESQPLTLRQLQATRTQIKKELTRLEARTLMGKQTVMRRRKRKALRNDNNKAAKGYQQKINKLKKKEDKKRETVRKLNEKFDEQESKLQQIQASKISQVANKATNMSKEAVLQEARKSGKVNPKLIEAAKNNDSLFQQVLNEMPKNSAAVKAYNKRKLAGERAKLIAEDSGLSLGQRLARGESLIGLGLGIGGVGMVAGKLGLRVATKQGLTAVTAKAIGRGLKKGAVNSKAAIRNIKFQTDVAKAARKSQKATTFVADTAGNVTKVNKATKAGKATKEAPTESKKVVDEAIDGMNQNPAGYTSKARSIADDIKKYEEKFARGTSRQRGAYRRHINKLRAALEAEILKQPSITRRVLAAPREMVRNSGFEFAAARDALTTSLKAGVYRRRWPLAIGGISLTGASAVDAIANDATLTKNAWLDARDLGTGLPYALVTTGRAGLEAAAGDFSMVDAMWETYKDTDPVFLALQGLFQGEGIGAGIDAAERRPVTAALSAGGIYAVAGRGAGVVARGAGGIAGYRPTLNPATIQLQLKGAGRIKTAAIKAGVVGQQLRTPDRFMINSPGVRHRRYSPNLLTATVQKLADRTAMKKANNILDRQAKIGRRDELEGKDNLTDKEAQELAELATVRDLTAKEKKQLDRVNKEREAAMIALIDDYSDNSVAMLSLSRRKVISDIEKSLVKVANKLSKTVGPGAEKPIRLMASGALGGPRQAVASVQRLLEEAIEKRRTMPRNDSARTAQDMHIEQLREILRKPEYLTDARMWSAVDDLRKILDPIEDDLVKSGLLLPEQRAFAPWIHYAIHQMGARAFTVKNKVVWRVVDKNRVPGELGEEGRVLTLDDIKAHAKANGFEGTPVFFSARNLEEVGTGSSFNANAPVVYNESTLGELITNHRYDTSWNDIMRQAIGAKLNLTRKQFYDNIVQYWAVGRRDGQTFDTASDATDYFQRFRKDFEVDMVPLPIPGTIRQLNKKSLTESIKESGKVNSIDDFLRNPTGDVTDIFADVMKNSEVFKYNVRYALVPKALMQRLAAHAKTDAAINDGVLGAMNVLNREFKGAVLPFSVAWHVGNIIDMTARMLFDGVGPSSYIRGRRLATYLKKNHPELYTQFLAEIGGGHLIEARASVLSRRDSGKPPSLNPADDFMSSATLQAYERRSLSASQQVIYQIRADQQITRRYRDLQRGAFKLGEFIEEQARYAVAGKKAKIILEKMGTNWFSAMKLTADNIEDIALGLGKDRNLRELGQLTNKVLGDYTNMGPELRQAVRTFVPFGLWLRASARWMLTMPYNAPIKAAFFANVNRMTEAERKEFGLYLLEDRKTVLPAYLQGSIPGGTTIDPRTNEVVNTFFRTQQYTSLGPFYDLSSIIDFVLPTWSGINDPLSGVSWKGNELISTDGKPLSTRERYGVMATDLMETYVWPSTVFHKLLVGGTPADTSALVPAFRPAKYDFAWPWQGRKFMESIRKTFFPWAQRSYYIMGIGENRKIVYDPKSSGKDLFNPLGKTGILNPFRPHKQVLDQNRKSSNQTTSTLLGGKTKTYGKYLDPNMRKKQSKGGGSSLLGGGGSSSGGSTLLGK